MGLSNNASGIKAGTVAYFAASSAPAGFLKANGAAVSRATYAALFLAIGTTYGAGDGATTFNVPDLRGEFVRGLDDGRGVDSGRSLGTSQTDAFQGHWHDYHTNVPGSGSTPQDQGSRDGSAGTNATKPVRAASSDGISGTPRTAAETRPRNVAMLACIKF